jgi:hypothetical protein
MEEKKKYEFMLTEEEFYAISDVLKMKFDILYQEKFMDKQQKPKEMIKSQHKCIHPNGQTNTAVYDAETDILEVNFSVTPENSLGKGKLKFYVHK